ncbi:hypothetical protein [Flavisolibacter nicotianae]|uniref:hypothetical protein n=1 Tax=Flavisolibacter nicotianae TaxID=2364882 RepID=UPI000EAB787B|nr:hypothetical protein [Flavisolibacter nicotianae]
MKQIFVFVFVYAGVLSACNQHQKEESLQQKETLLQQKEQELLLKEKKLQAWEEALNIRDQHMDSTQRQDTAQRINNALPGNWNVQMTCEETTCAGSAVGDTKNEQWYFSYESNALVVKATADQKLVRVYNGTNTGNAIELEESKPSTGAATPSKITVRLHMTDETHMEGQREIARGKECKIVYGMKLEKQ